MQSYKVLWLSCGLSRGVCKLLRNVKTELWAVQWSEGILYFITIKYNNGYGLTLRTLFKLPYLYRYVLTWNTNIWFTSISYHVQCKIKFLNQTTFIWLFRKWMYENNLLLTPQQTISSQSEPHFPSTFISLLVQIELFHLLGEWAINFTFGSSFPICCCG